MRIIDLPGQDLPLIGQTAVLLVEGFADTGSVEWQNPEHARLSVQESLQEGHELHPCPHRLLPLIHRINQATIRA